MSDLERPKEPIANQDSVISRAKQFAKSPVSALMALVISIVSFCFQTEVPLAVRSIVVLLAIILVVFNLFAIPIQKRISKFGGGILLFIQLCSLMFCVFFLLILSIYPFMFLWDLFGRLITGQNVDELLSPPGLFVLAAIVFFY